MSTDVDKSRRICALIVLIACATVGFGQALAQAPDAVQGVFRYVGGERDYRRVRRAIADATEGLPRSRRLHLAAMLEEVARPLPQITLAREGRSLRVAQQGSRQLRSPDDYSAVDVRPGLSLRQRMVDGVLEQELVADGLTQRYRYAVSADGRTLTLSAELHARGADPIRYRLTYARR